MTRLGLILGAGLWLVGCSSGNSNTDAGMDGGIIDQRRNDSATGNAKITGEPCTVDSDCAQGTGSGMKARCLKTLGSTTFPNGYCSSTGCALKDNDPATFISSTCPDDDEFNPAGCFGDNNSQVTRCLSRCRGSADCSNLRGDDDYLCFRVSGIVGGICSPKSDSQCDPKVAKSCTGDPAVCLTTTTDNTGGACLPTPECSYFNNTGCDEGKGCYNLFLTNEGVCLTTGTTDGGVRQAGSECSFIDDCPGGYGCRITVKDADMGTTEGHCWKYCNTGNAGTQCAVDVPDGGTADGGNAPGTCTAVNAGNGTQPVSVVGICSKSK